MTDPNEQPGLPLRGLAMILTAVAVLLIAWGVYSLISGDEAQPPAAAPQSQSGGVEKTPEASTPAPPKETQQPKPAPAQPAQPAQPADPAKTPVSVLNNSPIQGLAGSTAQKLRDAGGWDTASVGNLPGAAHTFPESVVLYPKNDATARDAATRIGEQLGIPTRERDADVDAAIQGADIHSGPQPGAVVVVTTNDMPGQ